MEPKEAELKLKERHRSCCSAAEQARMDYIEIYSQMVSELRPSHLEAFAKVLMDDEKQVLQNKEELIDEVKQKLLKSLQSTLERFWQEYDVTGKIAALMMLKEQFRAFEGNNWDIHKKNPHERTLPLRMRFKETRLRQLQKQLGLQNALLEEIQKENTRNRAHVHAIQQERTYIKGNMVRYGEYMKLKKSQILEMITEVLDALEGSGK